MVFDKLGGCSSHQQPYVCWPQRAELKAPFALLGFELVASQRSSLVSSCTPYHQPWEPWSSVHACMHACMDAYIVYHMRLLINPKLASAIALNLHHESNVHGEHWCLGAPHMLGRTTTTEKICQYGKPSKPILCLT